MTDNDDSVGPAVAAAREELPLTRETLLALREGRLTRSRARDVRTRLARDPVALALLGSLSSETPARDVSSNLTRDVAVDPHEAPAGARREHETSAGGGVLTAAGEPAPRRASTGPQRLTLVAVAVVVLLAALLWARHVATAPPDPRAAPVVPEVTMAQLGTLWPSIEGRFDRDLLDGRGTRCQPFRTPLAAQGAVVDGRYSMVVAYTADGSVRDDEIELVVVPLNCNDSDPYPSVTVPR